MKVHTKRTAAGEFLYKVEMGWAKWLSHHMWLWWVLNLTWGSAYSVIGAFIALFVLVFKCHRPVRCHEVIEFDFGHNWGGLEGVFFIFVSKDMGADYEEHTRRHELGHSFQNALFGPFNIFLTLLPSVFRYWYQYFRDKKGVPNTEYDLAWFEGSATDAGEYYVSLKKSGK